MVIASFDLVDLQDWGQKINLPTEAPSDEIFEASSFHITSLTSIDSYIPQLKRIINQYLMFFLSNINFEKNLLNIRPFSRMFI
jgi:hypothetical protein